MHAQMKPHESRDRDNPDHKFLGHYSAEKIQHRLDLDQTVELSSDLEWLLPNPTVGPPQVINALVYEYYADLYWFALHLLDNPVRAKQAVYKILARAALNRFSYQGDTPLHIWLYRQAVPLLKHEIIKLRLDRSLRSLALLRSSQASAPSAADGVSLPRDASQAALWLAIDSLPPELMLISCLCFSAGWSCSDAALALGLAPDRLEQSLQRSRRLMQRSLHQDSSWQPIPGSDDIPHRDEFDRVLIQALQERWPRLEFTPDRLNKIAQAVLPAYQRLARRQGAAILLKRGWLAAPTLALLLLVIVWAAGRFNRDVEDDLARDANGIPTPLSVPDYDFYYRMQVDDTLESVAAKFGLTVEALSAANDPQLGRSLFPYYHLRIPYPVRPLQGVSPTPIPPQSRSMRSLNAHSTIAEIQERAQMNPPAWHTAWIDFQGWYYGSPGYIGPARRFHYQNWATEDGNALRITAVYNNAWWQYTILKTAGLVFSYRGNSGGVDLEVDPSPGDTSLIFDVFSSNVAQESYVVTGTDWVAGRPAVILEQQISDAETWNGSRVLTRLWVDAVYGVVLKIQYILQDEHPTLLVELAATQVAFNVDFPVGLFDPQQAGRRRFARDYWGEPVPNQALLFASDLPRPGYERMERQLPPASYDPRQAILRFQFPVDEDPFKKPIVELFADAYYLGNLPHFDPWNSSCARSSDGRWVILTGPSYSDSSADDENLGFGWFEVIQSPTLYVLDNEADITQVAFAPDDRRAALAGSVSGLSGVYILDVANGRLTRLFTIDGEVQRLQWSPDGISLALVLQTNANNWSAMIVDVASGQAVYTDVASGQAVYTVEIKEEEFWNTSLRSPDWPAAGWPGHAWQSPDGSAYPFSQASLGLSDCVWP